MDSLGSLASLASLVGDQTVPSERSCLKTNEIQKPTRWIAPWTQLAAYMFTVLYAESRFLKVYNMK